MTERADARLPVTHSTKDLLDERKDDKKPYDLWVREQLGVAGDE